MAQSPPRPLLPLLLLFLLSPAWSTEVNDLLITKAVEQSLDHAHKATVLFFGDNNDSFCLDMALDAADNLNTLRSVLMFHGQQHHEKTAERVLTLASSALTKIDTCLDDMQENSYSSDAYKHMQQWSMQQCAALGLIKEFYSSKIPYKDGDQCNCFHELNISQIISQIPEERTVTVAKDGSGNFSSIQEAVDFAPKQPKDNVTFFKIFIKEGVYHENVVIRKKNQLVLVGEGINRTVITGNRSNYDGFRTHETATFTVSGGVKFIAFNITFENTAGPAKHQAVAVLNDAEQSVFYKCSFFGYQDTLFANSKNQFYRECDIYGTIDFIFGNAAAVFQNCDVYVLKPMHKTTVISAQGRKCLNDVTGFSFINSTIRAASNNTSGRIETYLGRPWKQYSRTVYIQSRLDLRIEPRGWLEFNGSFALDTLYYGEYGNRGIGADTNGRVRWKGYDKRMDRSDALNFTVDEFISGRTCWLDEMGVPFFPSLLD